MSYCYCGVIAFNKVWKAMQVAYKVVIQIFINLGKTEVPQQSNSSKKECIPGNLLINSFLLSNEWIFPVSVERDLTD